MAMMRGGTKSSISPQIIPIKIFTILPNKKGKIVVKNLRTGKEQTIGEHINELKRNKKIKTFKLKATINGENLGILNIRSRTKKLAIQQGIKEAKLDARFSPGVKIKVKIIK